MAGIDPALQAALQEEEKVDIRRIVKMFLATVKKQQITPNEVRHILRLSMHRSVLNLLKCSQSKTLNVFLKARTELQKIGIAVPKKNDDSERFNYIMEIVQDAAEEFRTLYNEHPVTSEQPTHHSGCLTSHT
jgi:hypothetical protein